ncbi:arsenate reductase (glutaredoxin) [Sphingomonas swuensis]|uniref:Arsenate reductase n=1 Tax=Sphingomonas swuensis TaxID=977800 RepID=A0ABP7SY17_9SPHN
MAVTVYHNPACGTSRGVLAMLEERGIEPTVVEYLKNPPARDEIRHLARSAGVPLRTLLRANAAPYEELGLADEQLTDEQLLDAIEEHPILLNRPIVVTDKGTALCRPKERLLDLL